MEFVTCPVCTRQCEATDEWCTRCRTPLHRSIASEPEEASATRLPLEGVVGRLVAIGLLYALGVVIAMLVSS